jgi:hypothetical protein
MIAIRAAHVCDVSYIVERMMPVYTGGLLPCTLLRLRVLDALSTPGDVEDCYHACQIMSAKRRGARQRMP